ncbi:Rieske (2Fe-2S) protein [Streptomyces ficellus]|uniref:Cytochrome bc1 complex Rieske iron-sulfur subunit n=1 Tax=Streptomyces ficellus TaxID=1977088 RepID=A0A6I6FCB6_9ACTN|nr:Rieske (2Fe-2S) protein [Streptomyces ficellus]QGV81360.1 Rieske (2Fe-2S) protein [Streptomyces ficellus]
MTSAPTHRRTVLTAAASATAALVTGCGDGGGEAPATTASPTGTAPASPPSPADSASVSVSASASASASASVSVGAELARTADIPSGGGKIFKEQKIVVTQPQEGEFKAFSAVCTHQACLVSTVANGTINCPCHGSRFRVADGSVERGPATRPLPAEQITVAGDSIRLA